ncbi:hypothetical protein TNCV_834701 [Trichonephila clavipes]|nr:hypothetical protein TNCV_834701 [Trichonephila clavipes]
MLLATLSDGRREKKSSDTERGRKETRGPHSSRNLDHHVQVCFGAREWLMMEQKLETTNVVTRAGQHPCPPENRRACRKGPVRHEFYVDVSGDSRVQWSDETQQLLDVLATWEDPEIIPPDLIGISRLEER